MVYIIHMVKQMKKMKVIYLSLVFITFVLAGIFLSNVIYQVDAEVLNGEGTSINPYQIHSIEDFLHALEIEGGYHAYYKLMKDLSLPNDTEWSPVGTETKPFCGQFDGNGKSITEVKIVYDAGSANSYVGFFGKIENAKVINLNIDVSVSLQDNGAVLPKVEVGAIAGRAIASEISKCQIKLEMKAERADSIFYSGKIVAGSAVGYAQGLNIYECGVRGRMRVEQVGANVVDSYFGGIVGQMDGGEMTFNYLAPSDNLIVELSGRGWMITELRSQSADFIINSNKSDKSVSFGGLVGYASGLQLKILNNVFSSIFYSREIAKINAGGIVGKISQNNSLHPGEITHSRYLTISSESISSFSSSVGNGAAVGYVPSTTNKAISAIPAGRSFYEENWDESRSWDFKHVWKGESIYPKYFFPELQVFSSYMIRLSTNDAVEIVNGQYRSGYIKLYFIDEYGNIQYDSIESGSYLTEKSFLAGEEVRIRAVFYDDNNPENDFRNFKHYYSFTNWILGGTAVAPATSSNADEYSVTSGDGQTTIQFTASSATEGAYTVRITGKEVKVRVNLVVENGTGLESNFGSVNYTKMGNIIENKSQNFEINAGKYQSGVATILEAVDLSSSQYVFAQKWEDGNFSSNYIINRRMSFELDNSRNTTASKFFPRVVYDPQTDQLVANIACYFSNNTTLLTLEISKGGSVSINGGDSVSNKYTQNVVRSKTFSISATADEGYRFVGWEIDGEVVSSSQSYEVSINNDQLIIARFESLTETEGFPIWGIVLIVIGGLLVVGTVVLAIVLKVRKNSFRSYRKNYRY